MPFLVLIGSVSSLLSLAGQIAYLEDGAAAVLDLAGGARVQVGPGPMDGAPCWSPDGAWLAFETSAGGGGRGIYVVAHDGAGGHTVGVAGSWNTSPAWSTDGTRLVYLSAPDRGSASQLRVVDLNTGDDTVWAGGRAGLAAPHWLPYTLLLRHLDPDRHFEVSGVDMTRFLEEAHMRDLDLLGSVLPDAVLAMQLAPREAGGRAVLGSAIVLVTRSEVLPVMALADPEGETSAGLSWGVTANWSDARLEPHPEMGRRYGAYSFKGPGSSSRVAFESNRGGDREIYVLGKRGIANVSNHRSADWNPAWSPDGKILAFESFRSGRRGVYRLYADTAHVLPVAVRDNGNCWAPAWSPDGEHLAFVSDETGDPALYAVALSGGEAVLLTDGKGAMEAPSWRPAIR